MSTSAFLPQIGLTRKTPLVIEWGRLGNGDLGGADVLDAHEKGMMVALLSRGDAGAAYQGWYLVTTAGGDVTLSERLPLDNILRAKWRRVWPGLSGWRARAPASTVLGRLGNETDENANANGREMLLREWQGRDGKRRRVRAARVASVASGAE